MKTLILTAFVLGLSGCASLHKEVYEKIHEGDSRAHVEDVLGTPDAFAPSTKMASMMVLSYGRRSEVCQIGIVDGKVYTTYCDRKKGYVEPVTGSIGAIAGGFGKPYQNDNSTRCVTTGSPGYYTTNCY